MKQTRETLIKDAEKGIYFLTGMELDYEFEDKAEHKAFYESFENAIHTFRTLLAAYTETDSKKKVYLFDPTHRTDAGGYPVYVGVENENGYPVGLAALCPKASQAIINHSPNGFSWGYGGSGPAQCALGILLDMTGDKAVATRWYQTFKSEVIAHLPTDKKTQLSKKKIRDWLQQKIDPEK